MRQGNESLSLMTGIIIALLILFSLSFISCTVAKQQAGIQSRVNFDRLASYLQQCQQLGQKDCYCDPPVQLDAFSEEDILSLATYADGLYADLQKSEGKQLQHNKITDKGLCDYLYYYPSQSWKKDMKSSYTFRHLIAEFYYFYLDQDQNVCLLTPLTTLPPDVRAQLRSCSSPNPVNTSQQAKKPGDIF